MATRPLRINGFYKKTDADGNVTIYKARFVAKRVFRQIQEVDYDETLSLVAMLKSV